MIVEKITDELGNFTLWMKTATNLFQKELDCYAAPH